MKRFAGWLAMSTSVPAAVLFVLMASPARLYAETGQPLAKCSDPNVAACATKSAADTCTFTFGGDASTTLNAFCTTSACVPDDGGATVTALACALVAPCITQLEVDDCSGKSPGDSCNGDAGRCELQHCPVTDAGQWDGGSELACIALPPPVALDASADAAVGAEPDASATSNGCSCDAAGSPTGVVGSIAALVLALVAVVRSRSGSLRADRRAGIGSPPRGASSAKRAGR